MAFTTPDYTDVEVDLAGEALVGDPGAIDALEAANLDPLTIINNWRASHAYPLNTFQMTLRNRAKRVDPDAIVAQRVKRLRSVEAKLQRMRQLKLSQMQDIAGCRVIVDSVDSVRTLVDGYANQYRNHVLSDSDDYITKPKGSGYRGVHPIYRYNDPNNPWFEDLKIEMQFRSGLQHAWATAVETVDLMLQQGLKASRGDPEWARFFALMSSTIAVSEGCRHVPRTPRDPVESKRELREFAEKLEVKRRLNAFRETIGVTNLSSTERTGIKYIVMVLDLKKGETELYGYTHSAFKDAAVRLAEAERFKGPDRDAVLVSVSDAANLQRAYPNYFLDTDLFIQVLDEAVA